MNTESTEQAVQPLPSIPTIQPIVKRSKFASIESLSEGDFETWLTNEHKYWFEISENSKNQPKRIVVGLKPVEDDIPLQIQAYSNALGMLIGGSFYGVLLRDNGQVETHADMFRHINIEANLPMHDDPLADDFKTACYYGNVASAVYAYRTACQHQEQYYLRGYNEGVSKNIKQLSDAFDDKVKGLYQNSDTSVGMVEDFASAAETKIANLVEAATSAISLSEPVKFWDERKLTHKQNAKKYASYAKWSGIGFGVLLFAVVLYEYLSGVPHEWLGYEFTLPKTLSGIATIILISTAGIWSTRIFVKLMMANLTLETESIERSTMIKTFVAMKAAEGAITQEGELLFYTTLFRPSNNVINEDSTAPEFAKLLEVILKSKSEKD